MFGDGADFPNSRQQWLVAWDGSPQRHTYDPGLDHGVKFPVNHTFKETDVKEVDRQSKTIENSMGFHPLCTVKIAGGDKDTIPRRQFHGFISLPIINRECGNPLSYYGKLKFIVPVAAPFPLK